MKSFVYTVVAATIAASSAAANSTDASTSGTVPTVQPYCQFSEITDGEMAFVPGFELSGQYNGTGFWRTHRGAPATIRVQAAGASKVSVIGGNKVINRSDGTEYPVKVDYSQMGNVSTYTGIPEFDDNGFATAGYITALTEVSGVGGHWDKTGLVKLFYREQSDPTWVPAIPQWGLYPGNANSAPTTDKPELLSNEWEYVHDRFDVEFHPLLEEANLFMHIQGAAWMLDSNGEMRYEDDGMGRTTPNGRKLLSYYGMTDGDYYIEHTVQCLQ